MVAPRHLAGIALALLALLAALPVRAAENLALRRPYTLHPAPDYPYCTDAGDATDLTDGALAKPPPNAALWVAPGTVGWSYGRDRFLAIEIDLGQIGAIDAVTFHSAGGAADVAFPLSVRVFVSDDQARYDHVGEVVTEAIPQERYATHRFALRGLRATGRFVRLVVTRGGMFCFCDEIEVWGTRSDATSRPDRALSRDETDRFARERLALARQNLSSLSLLRAVRERLDRNLPALDRIKREVLARPAAETVQIRRGAPYTTLDRRILQALGQARRQGLVARLAAPFAPLHPADAPGSGPAPPPLRLLHGEWGEMAVNLANATGRTRRARVAVQNLRRDGRPASARDIRIAEVVFVEAFGFRLVADALVPLRGAMELPAGMTKQIWLTIRTGDMPPGNYRADVVVSADDGTVRRVPLGFTISRVAMPASPRLTALNFSYLHWPLAQKFPADVARDLREHYIGAQVIPPQAMPYPRADAQGEFTAPLDFAALDRYLALLPQTRLWILWAGFEWDYGQMAPRPGDARRERIFTRWVQDVLAHLAQKGYGLDRVAFFWVDEPAQQALREIVAPATALLRKVAPGARVWMDVTGDQSEASLRAVGNVADIWCPESRRADWAFWKGKPTWFYTTASNKGQSPTGFYRLQLWQAFRRGNVGHAFWVYTDDRANDLWDDFSGDPSYSVVYDGASGVVPSKRWEAYRAGIEDYEVCALLGEAIPNAGGLLRQTRDLWIARVLARPDDPILADRAHTALVESLETLARR